MSISELGEDPVRGDLAVREPDQAGGSVLRRRPVSRAAMVEFGALVLLGVAYTVIRAAQGEDPEAALAHGRDIVTSQWWLFETVERPLNGWLAALPLLAVPACYFYAVFHYVATPAVLVWSWRRGGWTHRRGYWSLVLASAVALVVYARYPAAPPRLMPDLGVIDVMREFSAYGWWGDAASAPRGIGDATNQFAAMPSLHFGWSLWCGVQMWSFGSSAWRVAAVTYPAVQAVVVVATGNHFTLDVLAGGACVVGAFAVVTMVGRHWSQRQLGVSSVAR